MPLNYTSPIVRPIVEETTRSSWHNSILLSRRDEFQVPIDWNILATRPYKLTMASEGDRHIGIAREVVVVKEEGEHAHSETMRQPSSRQLV
jgi:hypothetical protein